MRKLFAYDTETFLIRQGVRYPEMVCFTYAMNFKLPGIPQSGILEPVAAVRLFRRILSDPEIIIVGANTAFDLGVMIAAEPALLASVFDALDADRVTDVQIRQKLLDLANDAFRGERVKGKWRAYQYSLDALAQRLLGKSLGKSKDANGRVVYEGGARHRLRYRELYRTPIADWPADAVDYALTDAVSTLDIAVLQQLTADTDGDDPLNDEFRQQRRFWALDLASAWGLRTDLAGVDAFESETNERVAELRAELAAIGLVRPDRTVRRRNGTRELVAGARDTKAAKARMLEACAADGVEPQLTETGDVSLTADACERVSDPYLQLYAELSTVGSVASKDIPMLRSGVEFPISTRFDMAATGRSTSAKPNVQNVRRFPGIRECFVPRPGYVFYQADYSAVELCTLAQVCIDLFGESELARAINAGIDPHTKFAASLLEIDYKEAERLKKAKDAVFDQYRQTAKVFNFGRPGGMGDAAFVAFAWTGYKVRITEAEARAYGKRWFEEWPEMRKYFAWVNANKNIRQFRSNRIRSNAPYCARCNTPFQGLAADIGGAALYSVARHQYRVRSSPLYGTHTVNFVHDEIIGECRDDDRASDVAHELGRVMVEAANVWTPDVPCKAEPCLMAYWSKEAKTIYDDNGKLLVWRGNSK